MRTLIISQLSEGRSTGSNPKKANRRDESYLIKSDRPDANRRDESLFGRVTEPAKQGQSRHSLRTLSFSTTLSPRPAKEEEEENLVEIVESPIEISRYVDHVRDPAAGAIATFEGTTRDTFEGRRVVELRYEAYVPMALRRLRAACAATRAAWSIRRLAVAHRLGVVPVGDASVLVAASAAHRADALVACRFLIDEVKASVPIWKEVYEDGEMWKENAEFIHARMSTTTATAAAAAAAAQDKRSSCCFGGAKVKIDEGKGKEEAHHSNGAGLEGGLK